MNTMLRNEALFVMAMPPRDDHDDSLGSTEPWHDASERTRAEEQFLTLSRAVEQSATMVLICDDMGNIEYTNPRFTQVTGYTAEELIGENVRILKSGRTPDVDYAGLWHTISGGRDWKGQFCNRKKNGEFYWAAVTISPIRNVEGIITHYVSVQEDITERRDREEQMRVLNEALLLKQQELLAALRDLRATQIQLVEAEKMKTIGHLAAGVAHEVKNPLSVIKLGIEYLSRQSGHPESDVAQVVTDMRQAVNRAASVVGELLALGRAHELTFTEVDVNRLVEGALALLRVSLDQEHIKVTRELAVGLPSLRLDARKIEQVLINLVMNAVHAMPAGGVLTVRTRRGQLATVDFDGSMDSSLRSRFRPGDTVVVVDIDDTGSGIPVDKLPRVFEPFFTTKAEGVGTGLGLTVCKTIVDLHGGVLTLRNRPQGGVRASVMFKVG